MHRLTLSHNLNKLTKLIIKPICREKQVHMNMYKKASDYWQNSKFKICLLKYFASVVLSNTITSVFGYCI